MESKFMTNSALIIFIKNPVKGKVKTRLAATIGEREALMVYERLLDRTKKITLPLTMDKFVFYSDLIEKNDSWNETGYHKKLQMGNDLGERMANAFRELFEAGYQSVCIMGSDCYELETRDIQEAFNQLKTNDFVIGPAKDGGYYLLGMKEFEPAVFQNKTYSTDQVYNDAIAEIKALKKSCAHLQVLSDIDTEEDLERSGILQ